MKTTKVTEMCPHCQNEVTVQWNAEKDGYELYCPYCGFPIMLCSMCDARDGKVCDWEEIKGCKHSDERYRDYFYKNLSCENVEEITRSSRDNDGWIPVEERLPEESGYYRVTVKNKELGDITEETAWFAYVDDYDMDESEWRELYEYEEVIAWRELAPYNPGRSNDEKE